MPLKLKNALPKRVPKQHNPSGMGLSRHQSWTSRPPPEKCEAALHLTVWRVSRTARKALCPEVSSKQLHPIASAIRLRKRTW